MEQVLPQNGALYAEGTSASAPPYEAELVEDILSLMASFSAKIYGRRAAENRRKNKHLRVVGGDSK
jgi:predicted site-specific integrase-resolvase